MSAARHGSARAPIAATARLVLDPTRCTGHGMCAELFPEQISLDDWGYPMIDPSGVPYDFEEHAQRAVKACPVLALRLERSRT
jgi:ferredoxin